MRASSFALSDLLHPVVVVIGAMALIACGLALFVRSDSFIRIGRKAEPLLVGFVEYEDTLPEGHRFTAPEGTWQLAYGVEGGLFIRHTNTAGGKTTWGPLPVCSAEN